MQLEEALRLKNVEVTEQDGYDLVYETGRRPLRRWRIKKRPATPADVVNWDPVKGVLVTIDGQKIKVYEE